MSGDLRELYQELILEHSRSPRNYGSCDCPSHHGEGYNPLCGDKIFLTAVVDDHADIINDVKFTGEGCAISQASASLLTQAIKGKTTAEFSALFDLFHDFMVTDADIDTRSLGKLKVLAGVKAFPMRVKCATLVWHTLHNALYGDTHVASTETREKK